MLIPTTIVKNHLKPKKNTARTIDLPTAILIPMCFRVVPDTGGSVIEIIAKNSTASKQDVSRLNK